MLLHIIDVLPVDGSDPLDNAFAIINELHQYSPKLADKPRWLVFNKIDLLDESEVDEVCNRIANELGVEHDIYKISAASGLNTQALCQDIMQLLESMPKEKFAQEQEQEEVEFKWDTYHRHATKDSDDDDWDDWDDDDYDVEIIYER